MIKKWKPVLIAAALFAAAAFSVFRSGTESVPGEQLKLITGAGTGSGEAATEAADKTAGPEETETSGQQGFTEVQRRELEELVSSCLEQQLSQAVSAAVADSLQQNLESMMADGRLPRGVARYQEVQSGLVNINTADAAELTKLSGIGESRAQAIIRYREEHGSFTSIDELANISGISSGIVEKLRDQATL